MSNARTHYAVLRPEQMASHDRGGGARTTPLVVPSVGETSFINGITEFAGGAAIAFHSHNCPESVVLLSGRACLDVAGATHELKPFDTTYIAPNISTGFAPVVNRADEDPLDLRAAGCDSYAHRDGRDPPIAIEHAS